VDASKKGRFFYAGGWEGGGEKKGVWQLDTLGVEITSRKLKRQSKDTKR